MSETTEAPAVTPAEGTESPAVEPTETATTETLPAPEPVPEEPPRRNGIEKRFSEIAQQRTAAQREAQQERERADRLQTELERLRGGPPKPDGQQPQAPSQDDFNRAVEREASRLAIRQREHAEQQTKLASYNDWFSKGEKTVSPDFRSSCTLLGQLAPNDQAAASFLDAVMDEPNGHAVTAALAGNLDEAERILSLSPVKMGREIAKLAGKAAEPRPVSRAPAPIRSVSGTARGAIDPYDPNISSADYRKWLADQKVIRA